MTEEHRFWVKFIFILFLAAVAAYSFYSLNVILIPFFAGFVGAYILKGFVNKLERWHIDRGFASGLVIGTLSCLVIGLILFALPYIQQQLTKLAAAVPKLVLNTIHYTLPVLEKLFGKHHFQIEELQNQLSTHLGDILRLTVQFIINLLSSSSIVMNLFSWVVLTPLVMFYLLRDWTKILIVLKNLVPLKFQKGVMEMAMEVDQRLSAYASGQAFVCLLLSILYALGLKSIGLAEGTFLGILTGIASFIPYVGAFIGFLASLGLGFAQTGDFSFILPISLVFCIISFVEGSILTPKLIGKKIGLHPLWILFALCASGAWFGFFGLIFTLPVAASMGVLVRILMRTYQQSRFYQGEA